MVIPFFRLVPLLNACQVSLILPSFLLSRFNSLAFQLLVFFLLLLLFPFFSMVAGRSPQHTKNTYHTSLYPSLWVIHRLMTTSNRSLMNSGVLCKGHYQDIRCLRGNRK